MISLIKTSKQVLLNESGTPKFGCLMAMIAPEAIDKYIETFKDIVNADDLHENGYELEPHVTILYGFNLDFNPNRLTEFCAQYFPIDIQISGISRFECPEYDVIKFDIKSDSMIKLNSDLMKYLSPSITPSRYDYYHPHMTIAYVKKGSEFNTEAANHMIGKNISFNSLLYSLPEKQGRITIS
jgi:2'-5' RNA ligase